MARAIKLRIGTATVRVSDDAMRLARLFAMEDSPHTLAHINCGLHSGVAECCVIHAAMLGTAREHMTRPMEKMFFAYVEQWNTNQVSVGIANPCLRPHLCPACIIAGKVAHEMESCRCWDSPDNAQTLEFA